MARKHRIAAITILLAVAALATVGLSGVYLALAQEQPFYSAALSADPRTLEAGSRELESRASALYSETRQPGTWQVAFTEDQINGWLAVRLANAYSEALPENISEPRVSLADDHLALAFRTRRGGVQTVVTARATLMLTDDGKVAIRLHSVHAGALPLPVMQVADDVLHACQEFDLPVSWMQVNGQPVALIDVNRGARTGGNPIALSALELRQRMIYIEGRTLAAAEDADR